jgi:hypothetical protein
MAAAGTAGRTVSSQLAEALLLGRSVRVARGNRVIPAACLDEQAVEIELLCDHRRGSQETVDQYGIASRAMISNAIPAYRRTALLAGRRTSGGGARRLVTGVQLHANTRSPPESTLRCSSLRRPWLPMCMMRVS